MPSNYPDNIGSDADFDRYWGGGDGPPGVSAEESTAGNLLIARMEAMAGQIEHPMRCTRPAYGVPGHEHCAACCFGTGFIVTCDEDADMLAAAKALRKAVHTVRFGRRPPAEPPAPSSPRQRWGTCCPRDPECDHSFLPDYELEQWMDTPITDLQALDFQDF